MPSGKLSDGVRLSLLLLLLLLCLGAIRQAFSQCKIEFIIVIVTAMSMCYQASFQPVYD